MKKIILLLCGGLLLVSCQQGDAEKTAYVDNATLKENFKALEKANDSYGEKMDQLEKKAQEEGQKFQKKVQDFQEKMKSLSNDEADKQQKELLQEQQRLQNSFDGQESDLREGLNAAHDSLEDVLKSTVKKIAKDKNYTYVFGMNDDFNLLYAKDQKDITQDVLDELNK